MPAIIGARVRLQTIHFATVYPSFPRSAWECIPSSATYNNFGALRKIPMHSHAGAWERDVASPRRAWGREILLASTRNNGTHYMPFLTRPVEFA